MKVRQHSALTCFFSPIPPTLTSHILNVQALNPPNFSPRIHITSPPELFCQDTEVFIGICQRNVKAEASCAWPGLQQREGPTAHNRTVLQEATAVPSHEVDTQPTPYYLSIFDLLDANLLSKITTLSCAAMKNKII